MHSPNRAEDLTPPSLFQFVLSPQQRLCLCGGLKPIRIKVLKEPQIYKTYIPNKGSRSPTLSSPLQWDTACRELP